MKIAAAQTEIKFEDKEYNLKKASELIAAAARNGAELILFPEMSFTGFSMNIRLTGEAEPVTISRMMSESEKHSIAVGFGYVRLSEGKAENHYVIADGGGIRSDYIKLHSFAIGGEGGAFRQGGSLPDTVSLSGARLTTFICYDLRFPEVFRAVTDRSDIIAVAANWPAARRAHWETLLRARAVEDQAYIIGVNCVGVQDGTEYSGGSMVIDPDGEIIARCADREELLFADIPNDTAERRAAFPALQSRRTEMYRHVFHKIY